MNNTAKIIDFVSHDLEALASEFVEYNRIKKDAEKELERLKGELIHLMDGDQEKRCGLFTIRNKVSKRKTFNKKRLEQDQPELVAQYTEEKEVTTFTVTV